MMTPAVAVVSPPEEVLPYNADNKLLLANELKQLLEKNGVDAGFKDISFYRMALVHKSYCTRKNENFVNGNVRCPENCLGLQECSNERLEFLGDSVLSLVVAEYLYERFPDNEEGFLTKMRTKLVNGEMLASLSDRIGLGRHVLISKQIEENNGRENAKILEDTFEAILGAIFLDLGFAQAKRFIITVLESNIDFAELVASNNNYKDTLIKYIQHNFNYLPKFQEMRNATSKQFTVCVKSKEGSVLGTGKGPNKKAAEANAALNALRYFGQV